MAHVKCNQRGPFSLSIDHTGLARGDRASARLPFDRSDVQISWRLRPSGRPRSITQRVTELFRLGPLGDDRCRINRNREQI